MVWGVRIVLSLEAEAVALLIYLAAFSRKSSVEKVARIKLNTRFCRPHLHHSASRWLVHSRSLTKSTHLPIYHPRVVVASSKL